MRLPTFLGLVLTVVLASLTLPWRSHPTVAQNVTPAATPAGSAAAIETLVTTIVPAEAIPTVSNPAFIFWHATIDPEAEIDIPAELVVCCPGPQLEHVLAGELTLRVEGPLQILRASRGGTPAPAVDVAPGTDVVLRAGDTAVYMLELPATYHNAGTEPVQLLAGGLFADTPPTPPAAYAIDAVKSRDLPSPLPPGPLTMTLQQTTLASGEIFPAPPSGSLQLAMTVPDFGTVAERSDGSAENLGQVPLALYALIVHAAASNGATPAAS